jgi:hypothetical protein
LLGCGDRGKGEGLLRGWAAKEGWWSGRQGKAEGHEQTRGLGQKTKRAR